VGWEAAWAARDGSRATVWHPHQVGYGGNQKTCYLEALQRDADVVVMLHPDGQYEPSLIPRLVAPVLRGEADLVLGSRLAEPGAARAGGMPLHKFLANRGLTAIEKYGQPGPEGSLLKWIWSDTNQQLTQLAADVMGPEALAAGGSWSYELLRARGNSIEGGTTEILKNIIAERVLGLPKAR